MDMYSWILQLEGPCTLQQQKTQESQYQEASHGLNNTLLVLMIKLGANVSYDVVDMYIDSIPSFRWPEFLCTSMEN